jgi:hypothetical protein
MDSTPSGCKKILSVYLTQHGALQFHFEGGAEEMIEANNLHGLIGDVIAEFGENFRHKNRSHLKRMEHDGSKIIIPKGAIF